jgi:hypothetical protein
MPCYEACVGKPTQPSNKLDVVRKRRIALGASGMRSPGDLRERAAHILALVPIVRQRGDIRLATLLTERAAALIDQAEAAEAGQISPALPAATHPNVQQQQIPPNKGDA